MIIEVTMPDGEVLDVTLPDGLSDKEIQKEVDGVEAAYLLDANPDYLSSNATSEQQANAPVRAGQPTQVEMPIGMVDDNDITEVQREMLETARRKNTRGGIADKEQQYAIEQARGQALAEEGGTLFPYLRKARAEGTDEEMGALRDIAAMPGRGLAAIYDLYANGGYVDATPKTSEEYMTEGRVGKGILTSPTAIPSALAAMYAGGMSIPAQIGAQVAVNAPLMEDYGGSNLAMDAVLTALPAGLGFVAGKTKSAGMSAIRKALEAKGIKNIADDVIEQAYDMWAGKTAGEAISKKAGGKLAEMLDTQPVTVTEGWLKGLTDPSKDVIGYDAVRREIAASTKLPIGAAGRRTEDEAAKALKKVDWMEQREALLKTKALEGGYDPDAYSQEISTALGTVADVPELMANAQVYLTKAGQRARMSVPLILSSDPGPSGYGRAQEYLRDVVVQSVGQDVTALRAGKALQEGIGPGVTLGDVLTNTRPAIASFVKGNTPVALRAGEWVIRAAAPVSPSLALPYRTRLKDFYNQGESE